MLNRLFQRIRHRWQERKIFADPRGLRLAMNQTGEGRKTLDLSCGLHIEIRKNLWDARIVREIFVEQPYTQGVSLPPRPVIVDVGGYIGDFSLFAAQCLNARRVLVYEPTEENFELLLKNIALNRMEDRITAVPRAVGPSKTLTLNVRKQEHEQINVSEFFYPDAEKRTLPCDTLSDVISALGPDRADLLKLDCEGGEYGIVDGMTEKEADRFPTLVLEYHKVEGFEGKFEKLTQRLKALKYQIRVDAPYIVAVRSRPGK